MPKLEKGTYSNASNTISIDITHIDHDGGGFGGTYVADGTPIGRTIGDLAKGENQYWTIEVGKKYSIRFNYRDFGTPEGEKRQDQRNYGYFVAWVGYFTLEDGAFDVLHLAGVESYVPDPAAGGEIGIRYLGEHEFTRQKP